jgi:hypothetical protein
MRLLQRLRENLQLLEGGGRRLHRIAGRVHVGIANGKHVFEASSRLVLLEGAGSAAFVCGTLLSGQTIARFGIAVAVWLNAGLLAATALAEQPIGCALLCSKSLRQRLAAPLLVALGLGDRTR